jgi:prepilin-type N-terminal cleavage/methylation domain-containing protein
MKNLKKSSFTLIELVIAMIIIGIVITSIPMILATVSQNFSTSLKSNSFYNAYSTLALIESMDWDENNTKGDNYYKVLTAENGDNYLKCERNGTKELDNESGADCASENNKTSTIGVDDEDPDDSSTFDDVDDFNGYSIENLQYYNIKVGVRYVQDNANYSAKNIFYDDNLTTSNNTNIKEIEINVSNKKTGKLVSVIRGKSDNIGAVKIYSRNDL